MNYPCMLRYHMVYCGKKLRICVLYHQWLKPQTFFPSQSVDRRDNQFSYQPLNDTTEGSPWSRNSLSLSLLLYAKKRQSVCVEVARCCRVKSTLKRILCVRCCVYEHVAGRGKALLQRQRVLKKQQGARLDGRTRVESPNSLHVAIYKRIATSVEGHAFTHSSLTSKHKK